MNVLAPSPTGSSDTAAKPLRVVRVGLLGYGRVGQAVARTMLAERDRLTDAGVWLACHRALVRETHRRRTAPPLGLYNDGRAIVDARVDVVVEALGGLEPARTLVQRALQRSVAVVTANKTLVAHAGPELARLARQHGTSFAFDAAVVAGVPFVGALSRRPLFAAATRLAGVINGTSHFILCEMERGAAFDAALADAIDRGYAEPDASADIEGRDAAEKLAILLQLAGCPDVRPDDLTCASIAALTPSDLSSARAAGGVIKPAAIASLDPASPGAWIGPVFVPASHPLASLRDVDNAIAITSSAGGTVTFAGPGAGPDVTAATLIDDIVEAGTGGERRLIPSRPATTIDAAALREPPRSAWWLPITDGEGKRTTITPDGLAWRDVQAIVDRHRAAGRRAFACPILGR